MKINVLYFNKQTNLFSVSQNIIIQDRIMFFISIFKAYVPYFIFVIVHILYKDSFWSATNTYIGTYNYNTIIGTYNLNEMEKINTHETVNNF